MTVSPVSVECTLNHLNAYDNTFVVDATCPPVDSITGPSISGDALSGSYDTYVNGPQHKQVGVKTKKGTEYPGVGDYTGAAVFTQMGNGQQIQCFVTVHVV